MPAQDWSRSRKSGKANGRTDANAIPIGVVVQFYGGEVREGRACSVRCVMHDDSRKSAVINTVENLYFCHTCGKGGNTVNVVMEKESLGFKDALASAVLTNAAVEGDTASDATIGVTTRVGNKTQISQKTVKISGTLEAVDKAGRKSEKAYQLAKASAEIKRDMETTLLSNQASTNGNSSTARKLGGLQTWLATNGDFGFIFARPETGKTTFLASEISHMVQQTEGDIIWFNNEEQGNKVAIRCYSAVLGLTTEDLFRDIDHNQRKFEALTQKRIKIYDFDDSSRASRIDAILKTTNPALIIFDQIDKIKGFKADRNDLELKAIYQWAREIAKMYAPVIAVSQAGGEAEGKLWLTMDMVDGSKTAKQGEADWILGIGKEQEREQVQSVSRCHARWQ